MRCKGHERHNSSWRSVEWRTSRSAETQHRNGRLKMTATQRILNTLITYRMTTIQMTLDMTLTCIRNVGRMISRHCVGKFL
jgi:hypothetical protein